jgi:hypothetical protein
MSRMLGIIIFVGQAMLPSDAIIPLGLFTAILFLVSIQGLAASGHFPRSHRKQVFLSGVGAFILYGSTLIACISLVAAVFVAWQLIPWYAAIICGGLAILAAPLGLQLFSDQFVDGRLSLVMFAGACGFLAILLIWLMK